MSLKLVGAKHFVRSNPKSDKFDVKGFHHVEFWCADANAMASRFQAALGMTLIAKQDLQTGATQRTSYVLRSHELIFVLTAPLFYGGQEKKGRDEVGYDNEEAWTFLKKHGTAVRAVSIAVADAADAYRASLENGAIGVLEPTTLGGDDAVERAVIAEVQLYGDVVLRYVSGEGVGDFSKEETRLFLPSYEAVDAPELCYGLRRLDHTVGNVPNLLETVNYMATFTGFHEFAEFTTEDVGTLDSGLNSMVLASNNEMVLMPVNEPTFGTKRKSQIQTYLEFNNGPGLQHLALKTDDIFHTLGEMQKNSHRGGFQFMPRASDAYYRGLYEKIGDALTPKEYEMCEKMGILVDKDDQGVLLQIFTKPISDRPTIFLEIIQRVGCMYEGKNRETLQEGGCGGFGKGNFSELFKRIEDYEKELKV